MSLPSKHTEHVEQFLLKFDNAWQLGQRPEISDYLRDELVRQLDASTQAALLRELVMIDLEYRWKESRSPAASSGPDAAASEATNCFRLEDYCRRLPALGLPTKLSAELICQEYLVRHRWGDRPDMVEYFSRFRDDEELHDALLETDRRIVEARTWEHEWNEDDITSLDTIGRYRIIRLLDKGAQAYVFQAIHPTLQQEVVIKLSRFSVTLATSETARLLAEARILASLRHPCIARIYDFDFHEGRPFLVMDYIRGRNLCDVTSISRMSADDAVACVLQIAEALAYVHQAGVIHRDINPRNIVLDEQQQPYLIDFGVSSLFSASFDDPESNSVVCGTAAFMSPEQASGKQDQINAATDVFGTGALLYYLLSGSPPYMTEDFEHTLRKAQACDYSIRNLQQHCSSARLVGVVCRAMHPEPAQRFPNMEALAKELKTWRRQQRTRRYLPAAIAFVAIATLFLLVQWIRVPDQRQTSKSTAETSTAAPVERAASSAVDIPGGERFVTRVVAMSVQVHRGEEALYLGDVGFPRQAARLDDDLRVSCRFAAKVYCYLIALNTDGTVQPGLPEDSSQSPVATQTLLWPGGSETYYGLTDGAGTQGVLLISSKEPLPAYDSWIATHGPIPWRSEKSVGVWHWDSDRRGVSNLVRLRGELREREEPSAVVVELVEYCEKLVGAQGCSIQWMTFPVLLEVEEDEGL